MTDFYQKAKCDLSRIVTDDVVYFGEVKKVKLFESIDDPSLVNKSGGHVPIYFMGVEDDFIGIEKGQRITVNNVIFSVYAIRKTIYGAITVHLQEVGAK